MDFVFLAGETGSWTTMAMQIGIFAAIIVVMYFILIRPQKKKEKESARMRDNLQVGDEVTTVGGIIGRVVSSKDDTIVIETSADRNKFRIKKWAIQSCDTLHDV